MVLIEKKVKLEFLILSPSVTSSIDNSYAVLYTRQVPNPRGGDSKKREVKTLKKILKETASISDRRLSKMSTRTGH